MLDVHAYQFSDFKYQCDLRDIQHTLNVLVAAHSKNPSKESQVTAALLAAASYKLTFLERR